MDNKKVGCFIADLRKEKSMTQKNLAEKLNVSNKAVSKWENGDGYPEITTIPKLAEILGVTTSEIINGEYAKHGTNDKEASEAIIKETSDYFYNKLLKKSSLLFLVLSILFIISSFVCLLCNYLINNVFDWSLYPIGAFIIAWSILIPVLKLKKHRTAVLLIGLTITVIPYLFLVEHLTKTEGWVLPLALPITVISIIALGIIIFLFNYKKINIYYKFAASIFLVGVFINISISKIIENYVKDPEKNHVSMMIQALIAIFLTLIFIIAGVMKNNKEK